MAGLREDAEAGQQRSVTRGPGLAGSHSSQIVTRERPSGKTRPLRPWSQPHGTEGKAGGGLGGKG